MRTSRAGQRAAAGLRPPPASTVDEWADRSRVLTTATSSEPGPWRTDRTPHLRGPMQWLSPTDPSERVVLMWASQLGKSEVVLNWLGWTVEDSPAPLLIVQPTVERAEEFSRERVATMLAASPVLAAAVGPSSRDSANTIAVKAFTGGSLALVGANAPSGLASRPRKRVALDEVDRFPPSAGTEGDPVELAIQRAATFADRKILITSTPTIRGESRIERLYLQGDQRRYFVRCPHCGTWQVLVWSGFRFDRDPTTGRINGVAYYCGTGAEEYARRWPESLIPGCDGPGCGAEIEEWRKPVLLAGGEWRATAEGDGETISCQLPGWYAPLGLGWSWVRIARAFVGAAENAEALQVVVNTRFGEPWELRGQRADATGLAARAEDWGGDGCAPAGVRVVTCGIDVQEDRLEAEVVGWGAGWESWSLAYVVILGDPLDADTWRDLDQLRRRTWTRADGLGLRIGATCVDSGHRTQAVYDYCERRRRERVWAIKGMPTTGAPRSIWDKRVRKGGASKRRARFHLVGVDSAKDAVAAYLQTPSPGPGYCHFPEGRHADYYAGLAAEHRIQVKRAGRGTVHVWRKVDGKTRNESLDCRVYALAALHSLMVGGRTLDAPADPAPAEVPEKSPASSAPAAPAPPRRRLGAEKVLMPDWSRGGVLR